MRTKPHVTEANAITTRLILDSPISNNEVVTIIGNKNPHKRKIYAKTPFLFIYFTSDNTIKSLPKSMTLKVFCASLNCSDRLKMTFMFDIPP